MPKRFEKPKVVFSSTTPRFSLEKYRGPKTRFTCPRCRKKSVFAKYVDITTGEYVRDDIGRCNRETQCGYHKPPTGDLMGTKSVSVSSNDILPQYAENTLTNLIDPKYVTKYIGSGDNLSQFLLNNFDKDTVREVLHKYRVGTIDYWGGKSTIFFQIDREYDIRTGKIMLYNVSTGKRQREPFNHVTWLHTNLNKGCGDFNLTQCFFGEHLLSTSNIDTYKIVESEKTAIIASIYDKKCNWIATGGLQNINEQRLLPFKDKELIFIPDKGKAYQKWVEKIEPFKNDYNLRVTKMVEDLPLEEGQDIADFIIKKYKK